MCYLICKAASQNPSIDWIIVTFHKPVYTSPNSCSSCNALTDLRSTYHPLFDQYDVDLVLEGHVHNYQRTYPLKYNPSSQSNPIKTSTNINTYNNPDGQIYAIVGTGGVGFHSLSNTASYVSSQQDARFGYLDILFTNNGATLQATYYTDNSPPPNQWTISDQFTISKTLGTGGGYHYDPSIALTGSNFQDTASSSSLQLSQFTVASWFKTSTNFGSDAFIVNKGGFGGNNENPGFNMNYGLYMPADEKVRGGFETSTGTNFFISSPGTYNNGLWHYAVVTYDGIMLRLYVDGIQVNSLSTSSALLIRLARNLLELELIRKLLGISSKGTSMKLEYGTER